MDVHLILCMIVKVNHHEMETYLEASNEGAYLIVIIFCTCNQNNPLEGSF